LAELGPAREQMWRRHLRFLKSDGLHRSPEIGLAGRPAGRWRYVCLKAIVADNRCVRSRGITRPPAHAGSKETLGYHLAPLTGLGNGRPPGDGNDLLGSA
jgi:hypothetical protein